MRGVKKFVKGRVAAGLNGLVMWGLENERAGEKNSVTGSFSFTTLPSLYGL